jgi:hypothetical protein
VPTYLSSYFLQQDFLEHDYRSPHIDLPRSVHYVLESSAPPRLSVCFAAKLLTGSSAGARSNVRHAPYTSHDQTRGPSRAWRGTRLHGRRNGMRRCRAMLHGDCVRTRPRLLQAWHTPRTLTARRRPSIRSTSPLSLCVRSRFSPR